MQKVSFWCTLQITLTADLPLQLFSLKFSQSKLSDRLSDGKKRSANTHTRRNCLTATVHWSVCKISCFVSVKEKSFHKHTIDKNGFMRASVIIISKTGCVPGPQPHWLVKCHAVLSQMVKKLCLLITLTADFPCNFALTFPLSAKKGIDKQASAWHYIF